VCGGLVCKRQRLVTSAFTLHRFCAGAGGRRLVRLSGGQRLPFRSLFCQHCLVVLGEPLQILQDLFAYWHLRNVCTGPDPSRIMG